MWNPLNPYEVLGLKPGAQDDEIKKAYRRLVRQYHPDVSDEPDREEKMRSINTAWEQIGDPVRRLNWDRTGSPEQMEEERILFDAQNLLRQMFGASFDSDQEDPVNHVRGQCMVNINNLNAANAQIATAIVKIEKNLKRLNSKSQGKSSIIHQMMNMKIMSLKQGTEQNNQKLKVIHKALDLSHDFEFEPAQHQATYTATYTIYGGPTGQPR